MKRERSKRRRGSPFSWRALRSLETKMDRVTVNLPPQPERSYDALIEAGLLRQAGEQVAAAIPERKRCFVITTPPVRKHWGEALEKSLAAAALQCGMVEMPDGERHKNLDAISALARKLLNHNADRGSLLVALGGGVVGDVTGLLASLFMR